MAPHAHGEGIRVPRRDPRHSRRGRTTALATAGVLVAVGAVAWGSGVTAPWTDPVTEPVEETVGGWVEGVSDAVTDALGGADEPAGPADVPAPEALDLPAVEAPAPLADAVPPGPVSGTAVRRALAGPLSRPLLGPRVSVAVAGLDAEVGEVAHRDGRAAVPASTTKLLTSVAALHTLDPATRFTTRTVLDGDGGGQGGGAGTARVVLVGGGDPLLERRQPTGDEPAYDPDRADLATLARRTAQELREAGVRRVRLGFDDSLFSGPAWNPTWPAGYRDVVAPITALMVSDGIPASGFGRAAEPSYDAALGFADALRAAGVRVAGAPSRTTAPEGAEPLAEVESGTLLQVVDRILQVSDNEAAEVLLRHVGLAVSGTGSTAAGARGAVAALRDLGVPAPVRLRDGSGLSRQNLVAPETLVALLQAVAASDEDDPLRAVWPGLPVAGFSGSLVFRFDDAPAAAVGKVRAKTGTLRSVRSLAGIAVGRDGTPMVFALMADRIPEDDDETAEAFLDRAAAALAACRCGRAA